MNKKVRWGIIILIGAGLIGLWAHRFLPGTKKTNTEIPVPARNNARRTLNVNAIVIKNSELIDDYEIIGRLMPDEDVDLSFQTSGLVTGINFKEGTFVQEGQLLAKVNDAPLQAQLLKLEAQLKLAEDRVFRQSALLEKDAVSKEAYEQVKTDLESLKADIQLVKANIDLTELRAPFNGMIGLRQISEGAYASPNTIIAKLTKYTPIKLQFSVSESYAGIVKPGMKVAFEYDNDLNTYYGTVYAVESSIVIETNTLDVRATFPNQNAVLTPGRTGKVKIRMIEINDALVVPSEALIQEMGVEKVYLYKSGKAQPFTVTKGLRTASHVQIVDGLHLGDTVITSGTLQLRTGMDVVLDNVVE